MIEANRPMFIRTIIEANNSSSEAITTLVKENKGRQLKPYGITTKKVKIKLITTLMNTVDPNWVRSSLMYLVHTGSGLIDCLHVRLVSLIAARMLLGLAEFSLVFIQQVKTKYHSREMISLKHKVVFL